MSSSVINTTLAKPILSADGFHNLVYSISGTTHTIFLDNSAIAVNTNAGNVFASYQTISNLFFGIAGDLSYGYTGNIDDVKVFNRALVATDVSAIYNANIGNNIVYIPIINTLSTATKTAMLYSGTRLQSGAFGVRLLNSAYTGPVMQIKAGATGTPTDFYAPKNGTTGVNSLATSSGTTLASFLSGATAYVTIWYDQTGNSNHGVWVGSGSQPQPPASSYFGGTVVLPTYPPTFNTTTNVVDFTNGGYFKLPDSSFPLGNTAYSYVFKPTISGLSTSNPDYAFYRGGNWNGGVGNCNVGMLINRTPTILNGYSNTWINDTYYTTNSFTNGQVIADIYIGNQSGTAGRSSYYNGSINSTFYDGLTNGRSQTSDNNYIGSPTGGGQGLSQYYPNFNGTLPYFYWTNSTLTQGDINILGNTPV